MEYGIGELARSAGYAVQTIRYYEQIGLMPAPPRTEGRQRRYSEDHLDRLLFIRHARDLGFEIEDVRSLLDLASQPDQSCASVDAIAKAHVSAIDEKISRLTALRAELTRTLRACSKGKIAQCKVIDVLAKH
jgi:DNA-binding transcriptional MerR regulator